MLEKEFVITGKETRPKLHGAFPGPAAQRVVAQDETFIATTTKTGPVAIREAKGCIVLTVDGDVLLDFAAGVGVNNTGHCHPRVVQAVKDQADRFLHFAGTDFYYDVQNRLAERLTQVVPGAAQQKVFFTNSGTESTEAALKIAAWSSERGQFIAFRRAFHGRTHGSLALTNSKTVHRERFRPIAGVHHVPFPNAYRNPFGIDGYADPAALTSAALGMLEELFETALPPAEAAAMFVEPVQGEGGYNVPPQDYYPRLKKILDAHGVLLVADEVQTGLGRTGKMLAMEHFGVRPSITTLAKALGSGLPIGAAVFDAKLDFGVKGAHSNTFGGNPVACAAALATLDVLEEERLVERAAKLGPTVGKRLREIQAESTGIGDVRGLGLMWAAEWVKDPKTKAHDAKRRDAVLQECYRRGLVLLPCGASAIRFIPPLTITQEQLEGGLEVFREAVRGVGK
jgi:4-aminobutyrate aminotransferase